jgi:hypothetical protein
MKNSRGGELYHPQHGVEHRFGNSEPFWYESTSAPDWWACCSAEVVDGVVMHLALSSSELNEVREFGENAVDCCH